MSMRGVMVVARMMISKKATAGPIVKSMRDACGKK